MTKTNTNRTRRAAADLAKATLEIAKTDPLMADYLREVIADALRDFRVAETQVDAALSALR